MGLDKCTSCSFPPGWDPPLVSSFANIWLTDNDLKNLTLEDVIFRPVSKTDMLDVRSVHEEWFPIKFVFSVFGALYFRYNDEFYNGLLNNYFESIVATIPSFKLPQTAQYDLESEGRSDLLVGIIVYSADGRNLKPHVCNL